MNTLFEVTKEDHAVLVRQSKAEIEKKKEGNRKIYLNFRNAEDVLDFSKKSGIIITEETTHVLYDPNPLIDLEPVLIKKKKKQSTYHINKWSKYWINMPHFHNDQNDPFHRIIIEFKNDNDIKDLSDKIEQDITDRTLSMWHPKLIRASYKTKGLGWHCNEDETTKPKYPIYIVSKGRWDPKIRLTAKVLEAMKQPYYIVVEEQEYDNYLNVTDSRYGTVLILDNQYKAYYDTYDDLGLSKSTGPGPARNFAWDHSVSMGYDSHWVMDDNIRDMYRMNNNQRIPIYSGVMFRVCEDFMDRFENVYISGLQYVGFCASNNKYPPYVLNTRIYSCLLIRNDCKYQWRGRYNEDTDLSLRVLKDGDCTIQYNIFLQDKEATQQIGGGNTAEFYAVEDQEDEIYKGTSNKSEMLFKMHPDVTKNVWRFNRWHHYVDYTPFKDNQLILKPNLNLSKTINEYNMKLIAE